MSGLGSLSASELARLFVAARPPGDEELLGDHDGQILGRRWLARAQAVWIGKHFAPVGARIVGANRVRLGAGIVRAFGFEVLSLPSPFDGVRRRTLVYPGGLVRDEVVSVTGALLGRGFFGRGRLPVYFSLLRSES